MACDDDNDPTGQVMNYMDLSNEQVYVPPPTLEALQKACHKIKSSVDDK